MRHLCRRRDPHGKWRHAGGVLISFPKRADLDAVAGALAHRIFSNVDPLGRKICMGEGCSNRPWLTVVGVVGDSALHTLTDARFPQVFSPLAKGVEGGPAGDMDLAVRTSAPPLSLAAAIREQAREIDNDQPVARLRPLDEVVSASMVQPHLNALLLAGFAGLSLLLAAIGIYGVISCSVAQRAREIGIRVAVGATRSGVVRMVVGEGLTFARAGLGVKRNGGLPFSKGCGKALSSCPVIPRPSLSFCAERGILLCLG